MAMRKLGGPEGGAEGFVVTDLDGLALHAGVARCAPKVLADSAWLLARCATYQYASAGRAVGGASVGINATPDTRASAIPAAVAALKASAADGLALDAGKGLGDADLAPLHAIDGRPSSFTAERDALTGEGIAAAIAAVRPLDGATVAIEALDPVASALAMAVVRRGARIVTVALGGTAVTNPAGIDPAAVAAAVAAAVPAAGGAGGAGGAGADALASLGEAVDSAEVIGAEVDVLAVGSKLGAIDHNTAGGVRAAVVAPTNWVPVTTRALAVLARSGVVVLPDFVALAGAVPASGLDGEVPSDPVAAGTALVAAMVEEAANGVGETWSNLVLAACARAEAYLTAQGHDLPSSRPLG